MPSKVRFSEVRKRLEEAGYELVRVNGSHHIFTKPGESLVSIPVHQGNVKAFYVRHIEKILKGQGR
jgi:predicted RNA binding protein YcfA (HicA-like mRNA interferase family)